MNICTCSCSIDSDTNYDGDDPNQVVDYIYDYKNRLIGKILDDDGDGTTDSSTAFIHDDDQIIAQFDHTGTGDAVASDLSHRYLWGTAVDQLLADESVTSLATPGDVIWPLIDHLNTTRDLAEYDSGTDTTSIANHRIFDTYGNLTSETAPAVTTLFAFTARLFDTDTDLQNNLNRWYDPAVGRWLSTDPLGFDAGDANLYRYVANNPTILVDPSGFKMVDTKVKRCKGYQKGSCIFSWFSIHDFIGIDGKGWGFFEVNGNSTGQGKVRDDDWKTYPETKPVNVASGKFYSICESVVFDDEIFDVKKFRDCVKRKIKERKANPGRYVAGFVDCTNFVESIIQTCQYCEARINPIPEAEDPGMPPNCFLPDTLIKLESDTKKIKDIQPGMKVWTFDHKKETWQLKCVKKSLSHDFYGDIFKIKSGNLSIAVTGEHPFWITSGINLSSRMLLESEFAADHAGNHKGRWVRAKNLLPGDKFLTHSGRKLIVEEITSQKAKTMVYNLTVESPHNYAIGQDGILVHNKDRRT